MESKLKISGTNEQIAFQLQKNPESFIHRWHNQKVPKSITLREQ
jgi:hypothetical protein